MSLLTISTAKELNPHSVVSWLFMCSLTISTAKELNPRSVVSGFFMCSLTISTAKELDPQRAVGAPFTWMNSNITSNDRFLSNSVSDDQVSVSVSLEVLMTRKTKLEALIKLTFSFLLFLLFFFIGSIIIKIEFSIIKYLK